MKIHIDAYKNKFKELSEKISNPNIMSDPFVYAALMREYKKIEPIIDKENEILEAEKLIQDASEILKTSPLDADFKALASQELKEVTAKLEKAKEELKFLLLPHDPNDNKNVIIEIRSGTGGEEAALFSFILFRMYSMYADKKDWKTEILNINETELGGYKEISFIIYGERAYSHLKYESGVHRVQRVPETEAQGRVHTSTATVVVLPEVDEVEININLVDLKIDTYRAGGAGGQHVNKTESAIRITHIPTGIVVECQDERSQHKNRDKAMKVLRSRLYEKKLAEQNVQLSAERRSQVGRGDRSERIRTYNYPQSRLTDHRILLTLYRLEDILNGNLDEIIEALMVEDKARKLQNVEGL